MPAAAASPSFLTDKTALARLLFYVCAVLGAQRFLLHGIDAYVCVILGAMAAYYFPRDRRQSNTALLMAIFVSVDNGAAVYVETASVVRYALYLAALGIMVYDFRTDVRRLMLAFGLLLVPLTLTLFNMTWVASDILRTNFTIALISILVLGRTADSLRTAEIDWDQVGMFLLVFAICEVPNALFFHNFQKTGYLSYNGTKSFLVFAAFYYLRNRPLPAALAVLAMVTYVVLLYQTRMIVLSMAMVLGVYVLGRVVRLRKAELFLASLLGLGGYLLFTSDIDLDFFKIIYSFQHALKSVSMEDFFKALDPVRYYELRIFIERDWFHILFGNGFGSGLFDIHRYFSFIPADNTAFSLEELQSGRMYHFHDVWNDIGLRFGMIYVAAILLPLFLDVHARSGKVAAAAMTLIVLIFSAFFSTAGLIGIALIALAYRAEKWRIAFSLAEAAAAP